MSKRINDLTQETTVTDGMFVEVDDPSFIQSKKATVEEITETERTARIAQNNVIEAGAGLNADGTYTPPAGSGYMTAADFLAAGYTENMYNGLRLLDNQIQVNTAAISSILLTVSRTLSVAEINTLYTVPVVLVDTSAFAINKLVDVIDCVAWIDYGSSAWDIGTDTLNIGYASAANIMTFPDTLVEAVADRYVKATPIDESVMSLATDVVVRLSTSNPVAVGDSEITINISYRIITI